MVDENKSMLVFGGYGNNQGVAYSLNLAEMNWSRIDNVRYRRSGHCATLISGFVYLFGGEHWGRNAY